MVYIIKILCFSYVDVDGPHEAEGPLGIEGEDEDGRAAERAGRGAGAAVADPVDGRARRRAREVCKAVVVLFFFFLFF